VATSDLDLYVFRGATFVGGSSSGTSNEEANVLNPPAGTTRFTSTASRSRRRCR
jgi:hypothetical protein